MIAGIQAVNSNNSEAAKKAAAQQKKSAFSDPIVWATIGIFCATAVGVGVGYLQYLTLNKTEDILKDTLIAAHRPWITVSIDPSGPITWEGGGMQFTYKITLKNIGKSPAFDVRHTEVVVVDMDSNLKAEEKGISPLAEVERGTANIMPDDIREMIITYQVQARDIERGAKPWANKNGPKLIVPVMVGVVRYLTQFDDRIRHSDFIYEIGFWDSARAIMGPAMDPARAGEIPTDRVRILRHPFVDGRVD